MCSKWCNILNKVIAVVVILFITAGYTLAETRTHTIRRGVRTMYGYIPTPSYGAYTNCDPFVLTVSGYKYYMLIDRGQPYTYKSLLGCNCSKKRSLLGPLEALESDGDGEKLTPAELRRAHVRFVKLKTNGRLAVNEKNLDFDINKIGYVDLRRVRFSISTAPHGNFDVYIKRESGSLRKVVASVNSHSVRTAQRLFE